MRLIDADKMIEILIKSNSYHAETAREKILLARNVRLVKEQAEYERIEERNHGHWIDAFVGDMPVQVCSKCNTFFPLAYTGGGHRYCPNCGAKMDREDEDE